MPVPWVLIFFTIFFTLYAMYLFNVFNKIPHEKMFQKAVKISFIKMKW